MSKSMEWVVSVVASIALIALLAGMFVLVTHYPMVLWCLLAILIVAVLTCGIHEILFE